MPILPLNQKFSCSRQMLSAKNTRERALGSDKNSIIIYNITISASKNKGILNSGNEAR